MKKLHIAKTVCAVGLTAACAWSLAACTTGQSGSDGDGSGAVAATVNGKNIYEDEVTSYIENVLRAQMGVTDEDSWGQWLAQSEYTPESVREEIIGSFEEQILVESEIESRGITAEDSEVDEYLQKTKDRYEGEEQWQAALEQANMTEDVYRNQLKQQILSMKLQQSFAPTEDPSEADMLQYGQMYASTYDGARTSSHILFDANDEAKAQEVLDKINAGELDFAEAAKEYSIDTGTAQNGGEVGWDNESSLDQDYKTALGELEKDQVSGLVTTQFGIHIIKCTEVYNAPKTTNADGEEVVEITSIDQIPTEWADTIKELLNNQKLSENYQAWLEEAKEKADLVINPMPQGLPYIVDMTKYVNNDASGEGDGSGAGEGTTVTNEDGSTTLTKEDGTKVTTFTDGTVKTENPDGTYSETDAEGNTKNFDAEGNEVTDPSAEGATDTPADGGEGEGADASTGDQPAQQPSEQ